MTAVATLIFRKQQQNCNESDLADLLRWIHSPRAAQRVSMESGFVLAHSNAKLARLSLDLLAGFTCQTPPLEPDTQPAPATSSIIGAVFVGLLLLILIRVLPSRRDDDRRHAGGR
jgi:hypothetical protein